MVFFKNPPVEENVNSAWKKRQESFVKLGPRIPSLEFETNPFGSLSKEKLEKIWKLREYVKNLAIKEEGGGDVY
jgi:hypothetical protein